MKTNNRPIVKVVEYEFENISEFRAIKFMWTENKEILNSPKYYKETGNTREVERPMTDTEYIEHLEIKLQVLKELSLNDKESTSYFQIEGAGIVYTQRYVETQWKENQELKLHMIDYKKVLDSISNVKDVYKDQFLKIVESVIKEHELKNDEHGTFGCVCEMESRDNGEDWDIWFGKHTTVFDIADESFCFFEHLLQEIKSAMEKEKNANQRKD